MANEKKSTKQSSQSKTEESTAEAKRRDIKILTLGDTPIVITGGSVTLSYAQQAAGSGDEDGFDDDATIPEFPNNGKPKKKVRHRRNPTLERILITDKDDPSVIFQEINLENLRIHRNCMIRIYYG